MNQTNKKWWLLPAILAIILGCITIFNVVRMQQILLKSAQVVGVETAHRISLEEMNQIHPFIQLLDQLEIELRKESRPNDIPEWMQQYMRSLNDIPIIAEMDIYASINGNIVSSINSETKQSYNPYTRAWYQQAIDADGETIFTDTYMDTALKKPVITIAKKVSGTEDVVAIDLYFNSISSIHSTAELPKNSDYFMCDSKGKLLYGVLNKQYEQDYTSEHVSKLYQEITDGKYESALSYTYGLDQKKCGVYFYEMENGWYSIITIPYSTLLSESNRIWVPFFIIFIFFGIFIVVYMIRNLFYRHKLRLYNGTLAVLGNSYYALYQIDLIKKQYEMLKSCDYIRSKIPTKGDYSLFTEALADIIHPDFYSDFIKAFSIENMTQLTNDCVHNFGGDFKRLFNNEYTWAHIQMLYDESLNNGKVVLCFNDVNHTKKQELAQVELLQNSLNSVNEMAESKNRFFSNMSHDMRTPLNGIIGLSRLALQRVDSPEKTRDSLNKILSSSQQLLDLINDILEISKLEQGKLEISTTPFNLQKNLQELCEILQIQAINEKKKLIPEFNFSDKAVLGDWRRIQQVLNNILSNAFKYSKEGSTIRFTVSEFSDTNSKYKKYQFIVQDNGFGMSKEFLEKLFTPYEREVRFGASNIAGTGLGMTITKDLVTQMGGQIQVESELSKGTLVTITLPLHISNLSEVDCSNDSKTLSFEDMSGYHVLLAEDNEINMEITTELLQLHNFEVEQAWNGKEAIALFENNPKNHFDLILMDMQMPVMGGCDAAKVIRSLNRSDAKTIPIIAVTANAFSEDIAQTQQAGMNAHISKPIDFIVFEQTVKKLLS